MTIAGIVVRPHSVQGFANPTDFYTRAGIAAGGVFSAFVEVLVSSVVPPVADQQYAGNLDPLAGTPGGWAISRAAGLPCAFKFSTLGLDLIVPIEPSVALDRTFLLGISGDGFVVNATVDGVIVASGLNASPLGSGDFGLGGDPAGVRAAAADPIVFAGYDDVTFSAAQWADLWTYARQYAQPNPGHPLAWRALVLDPAEATGVLGPATWVNSGTLLAAGDLTYGNPGFGSFTFFSQQFGSYSGAIEPNSHVGPLLTPLDLYVAPTDNGGSDGNDGLSPASPVLTMAGAYSKIPTSILGAPVRIHIAAFDGTTTPPFLDWSPIPDFVGYNSEGQIIVYGDGGGQGGQDGFQAPLASSAAEAGTTTTSIDVTILAPAPDAFLGWTIELISGGVTQRRLVRNNTATAIIPDYPFTAALPGDAFRILFPSVLLNPTGPLEFCAASGSLYPTIINLGFVGGAGGNAMFASFVPCLKLFGCYFVAGEQLSITESQVFAGVTNQLALPNEEDLHITELWTALGGAQDWGGWGVTSIDGSLNSNNFPFQSISGFLVSFTSIFLNSGSPENSNVTYDISLFGGYLDSMLATVPGNLTLAGFGVPTLVRPANPSPALELFKCQGNVFGGDAALTMDLTNAQAGLVLTAGSNLLWTGPFTQISGDNAQVVVESANGSNMTFFFSAVAMTLSGAIGNTGFLANGGTINFEGGSLDFTAPALTFTSRALSALLGGKILNPEGVAMTSLNVGQPLFASSGQIVMGPVSVDTSTVAIGAGNQAEVNCTSLTTVNTDRGVVAGQQSNVITGIANIAYTTEGVNCRDKSAVSLAPGSTLTGNGPCLSVKSQSSVFVGASTLTSNLDTVAVVNLGGEITLDTGCSVTAAAGDGINCTGGGQAYFADATTVFAVSGFELIVGPGALEQSSFVLALPNPGDSFSNAGAGSSMTRLL